MKYKVFLILKFVVMMIMTLEKKRSLDLSKMCEKWNTKKPTEKSNFFLGMIKRRAKKEFLK